MIARASRLRLALPLLALVCAAPGCQKDGAAKGSQPPDTAGDQGRPAHQAHTHGELANSSLVSDLHAGPAPNTTGLLKSTHTTTSSYDINAPATVLVTTRWSHGSGVIIDPKGLVLTNFHVVESGETEDFEIEVGVTTAKLNKDGSADPDQKYRARALKVDPKRDLALLQIQELKGTLPAAPLAPPDRPRAGRKVSAIGNAGVGFGWAIKHCHINAIGSMESAAAAIFQQQTEALPEDKREEMAKAVRRAAAEAGIQIQTDCTVLPGDSGGPLIDEQTHELVGINAAIRTSTSGLRSLGSVAFHVHIKEIHDFLKTVPTEPQQFVPDPWELAGHQAAIDDTTKDGEVDSLRVGGHCGSEHMTCHGIFIDMDQDSFRDVRKLPALQEVYDNRSFDTEWVIFNRARFPRGGQVGDHLGPLTDVLLYFDADNDGQFDGVVVKDAEARKIRGYRMTDGAVTRDESLDDIDTNPQRVFEKSVDRENFLRFKAAYEEGTHATQAERSAAVEVRLDDHNGDGKPDTARVETRLDERIVIDIDEDSIPRFDAPGLEEALAAGKVDAELIAITASPYRIWYDRDNDGRLDLMLEGSSPERGFVLDAANIDASGRRSPAPEHIGRLMLRPALYSEATIADATERVLRAAFPQAHAALDDGMSSFPSPRVGPIFEAHAYEGTKRAAVAVADSGRAMIFLDLDKNTFKKKANKGRSLDDVMRDGAYDAEFVFMFDGALGWSFYDADNNGSFEQIWVSASPVPQLPRHKYTLGASVVREDPPAGTTMFEPSVFAKKKRLKKSFDSLRSKVVAF